MTGVWSATTSSKPNSSTTKKKRCQTHCFSTLNHILGWCYNDQRVIKYFFKQLAHGFQGMSGQM